MQYDEILFNLLRSVVPADSLAIHSFAFAVFCFEYRPCMLAFMFVCYGWYIEITK